MHEIGRIVRLQIQRASLKTGDKPNRVYDPAPLFDVGRLWLTPDGALGDARDGAWLVDVHHRAHPRTKNDDGAHGVSIGFTGHYGAMRERFGERIALGCAGENLIAQSAGVVTFDDVRDGLAVVGTDGALRVRLVVHEVAHPCRPFTGWALGRQVEPEVLKSALQFLDDGMRGFYCSAEGSGIVALGDRVIAAG